MSEVNNVVIIGSGPAGCTAAIYAARANLNPILVTGTEPGGQLTTTPEVGNWPGLKDNPSGFDVMQNLQEHAKSLGTVFISDNVVKASVKDEIKEITLASGNILKTKTVIIATGAKARYLGVKGEEEYKGKGVSACATCDGFFFRKKDVAVIGGGSAAFAEALFLASLCNKVYLVHRREGFRAEAILVDKMNELVKSGKVEYVLNATVSEIKGNGNIVNAIVVNQQGNEREIALQGIFVAIGHSPATELFKDELELDKEGYITVNHGTSTQTSVAGVFACGDCQDKIYRQAITSAGSGCQAALDVEHYLM